MLFFLQTRICARVARRAEWHWIANGAFPYPRATRQLPWQRPTCHWPYKRRPLFALFIKVLLTFILFEGIKSEYIIDKKSFRFHAFIQISKYFQKKFFRPMVINCSDLKCKTLFWSIEYLIPLWLNVIIIADLADSKRDTTGLRHTVITWILPNTSCHRYHLYNIRCSYQSR